MTSVPRFLLTRIALIRPLMVAGCLLASCSSVGGAQEEGGNNTMALPPPRDCRPYQPPFIVHVQQTEFESVYMRAEARGQKRYRSARASGCDIHLAFWRPADESNASCERFPTPTIAEQHVVESRDVQILGREFSLEHVQQPLAGGSVFEADQVLVSNVAGLETLITFESCEDETIERFFEAIHARSN